MENKVFRLTSGGWSIMHEDGPIKYDADFGAVH